MDLEIKSMLKSDLYPFELAYTVVERPSNHSLILINQIIGANLISNLMSIRFSSNSQTKFPIKIHRFIIGNCSYLQYISNELFLLESLA